MRRGGLSVAAVAAVMLAGTACNTVSGSGNILTRRIQVTSFTKLGVGSFAVPVSVGSSEAVSMCVDDNLVDSLDVGVSGDTLHIGQE